VSQSAGTSESGKCALRLAAVGLGEVRREVRERKPLRGAVRQENIFRSDLRACLTKSAARNAGGKLLLLAPALLLLCHVALRAQSDQGKPPDKPSTTCRVRIEVTGGDENKPVPDASVYLKFSQERKVLKDRAIEFNLKTNQEGVARSPEIPKGKILIQIVAPTWKTFGEYYDVNQDEQTIQIHLVRPTTKWY
jgi:hypothetical protein